MKKQLLLALLAVAMTASVLAVPAHAQASMDSSPAQAQQVDVANESTANESVNESERTTGRQDSVESQRRGPPAFVQDKVPAHVLDKVPDFFW